MMEIAAINTIDTQYKYIMYIGLFSIFRFILIKYTIHLHQQRQFFPDSI